ncbi:hypothetical protein FQN60_008983 [Etheostoma spectabile]|uniref:Uncharacterized protein n=1 Tax=Etheostoma spectabile TaxID=54343 RepID=A0A5J5CN99_9PERO|nr:hypothetical protein FQN60_008983 [Etheostoma spectabile]
MKEFTDKQTDAIKHTRLQIINEEAKSRLVEKPTRTNVRRKKTLPLQAWDQLGGSAIPPNPSHSALPRQGGWLRECRDQEGRNFTGGPAREMPCGE